MSSYTRRNEFLARVVWYLWGVLYGICGVYVRDKRNVRFYLQLFDNVDVALQIILEVFFIYLTRINPRITRSVMSAL